MNDSILPPRPGKRPGQKHKSLPVLQYLLKNTDDENAVRHERHSLTSPNTASIRPLPAGITTWLYPEGLRI